MAQHVSHLESNRKGGGHKLSAVIEKLKAIKKPAPSDLNVRGNGWGRKEGSNISGANVAAVTLFLAMELLASN